MTTGGPLEAELAAKLTCCTRRSAEGTGKRPVPDAHEHLGVSLGLEFLFQLEAYRGVSLGVDSGLHLHDGLSVSPALRLVFEILVAAGTVLLAGRLHGSFFRRWLIQDSDTRDFNIHSWYDD